MSVLGFLLALLAALCVAGEQPVAALGLWWLGRLADGTDGIYARATDRSSGFGAYFDIVLDMGAYGVMILAFSSVHPELPGRIGT